MINDKCDMHSSFQSAVISFCCWLCEQFIVLNFILCTSIFLEDSRKFLKYLKLLPVASKIWQVRVFMPWSCFILGISKTVVYTGWLRNMQLHNDCTNYVICKYMINTVYKLVGFTVAPKESNDWLYKLWLMSHILPLETYRFTDAEKKIPWYTIHVSTLVHGSTLTR